jgi:hypothetical protein
MALFPWQMGFHIHADTIRNLIFYHHQDLWSSIVRTRALLWARLSRGLRELSPAVVPTSTPVDLEDLDTLSVVWHSLGFSA